MNFRGLFLFISLSVLGYNALAQARGGKYYQKTKKDIILPKEAGENVLKLFRSKGDPVAVTSRGVFTYSNGQWNGQTNQQEWILAAEDPQDRIWLASTQTIQRADGKQEIKLPEMAKNDTLLCLLWENDEILHLGTATGLYTWNGKWHSLPELKGIRVNDVITDTHKNLWVATTDGLWHRGNGKWINLDEVLMAVGNERTYFSLATRNDGKDVVFSSPWSVGCIAENGDHWVWRGADGLPYGPAQVIRTFGDDIWLGTDKGAIQKDSLWHYYHGKRWLPDEKVNDILSIDQTTVWIATPNGISEISRQEMTLAQKAEAFEKTIELRHNRRGLINLSKLSVPGDLSTSYTENEDNDGLWTSCYLGAACFRYAVTKDPEAKALAIRTFEALERLETVTGISGYPARSYATASDAVTQSRSPHPKQWHLSPDGQWQWLDDTSSDEITGHLFTLSLFHELVADDAQKQRVVQLIGRTVTHIIENDFHLIDFDGKPTRWGIWNPDSLNHSPNWLYEKGLNSLQILSFLKTASHFTNDPKYEQTYEMLVKQHGYAQNAVQAKIYGPYETSHSDDILNFFPYYGLFRYTEGDPNRELYLKSLERSWQAVRADRMPVWNVIASALLEKDCDLDVALEELRQYPLDLIDWTMENSHRWDLQKDPLVDRFRRGQAVRPIPTPESGVSRWNTNPKQLEVGRRGETEESGTYFLFAYWMGRYYGFFDE